MVEGGRGDGKGREGVWNERGKNWGRGLEGRRGVGPGEVGGEEGGKGVGGRRGGVSGREGE